MRRVAIRYGSCTGWIYLRELRGEDEEAVWGNETLAAITLVDRLLVGVRGAALGPGDAVELTAADRDRALAVVYRAEFGNRIATTVTCGACAKPYDLEFQLDDLVASVPHGTPDALHIDGVSVRVPTGDDELYAAHASDPRATLLARIGAETLDPDRVAAALADAAPLLDLELDAACPECGAAQVLGFSIQDYLLGTVLAERERRAAEVHRLASAYGWSLGEIMALPRARRRRYVELAEREAGVA